MRLLGILTLLLPTSLLAGDGKPEAAPVRGTAVGLPQLAPSLAAPGPSRRSGSFLSPRGGVAGQSTKLQPLAKGRDPQQSRQPKGLSLWRPALVASAAMAVGAAAVAYWSSDEADAAYDRYLRSAGAGRQQQALERAERYDRIAGAAFVAMEAGIVLTACLVFF